MNTPTINAVPRRRRKKTTGAKLATIIIPVVGILAHVALHLCYQSGRLLDMVASVLNFIH